MTNHFLTKSDFKLGYECPFKLRYKKAKYPSTLQNNEMLEFFAEGGFMVEAIARAVMEANPEVKFEKSLQVDRFSARLDGFEQFADRIVLTEIKAKSVDGASPEQFFKKRTREVKGDWLEYMLDITFQVMVTEGCYPGVTVVPQICVVNKNTPCSLDAIYTNIDLLEDSDDRDRGLPRAVYTGDKAALQADHFLEFINVRECVDILMPKVREKAAELLDFLDGKRPDITPRLGLSPCKNCEYRDADHVRNGFADCWGTTPARGASVIDMYRAGNGSKELKGEVVRRIEERDLLLVDFPDDLLSGGSSYGSTRRNQKKAAVTGEQVVGQGLRGELEKLKYPLHFIDFEASRIPVPYLPGMKPYEVVAFQFSCHTLKSPTSTKLVHREWLNLRDVYPNEEFLRELRAAIGDRGTVLTWSGYELATLRHVSRQLRERGLLSSELARWLSGLIGPVPVEGENNKVIGRRVVDLLKISQAHYAHPLMRGSHSIKKVLDAIWSDAPQLWSDPWFAEYFKKSDDGALLDPYATLKVTFGETDLVETRDDEQFDDLVTSVGTFDEAVTDGVGAMRAYQNLLYGIHRGQDPRCEELSQALLAYCRLDTVAMVIIWRHWIGLCESRNNASLNGAATSKKWRDHWRKILVPLVR